MTEILQQLTQELTKLNANIGLQSKDQFKHYSLEQIAEIMHCHVNTVRAWIKDGEIKTFQYKGTMRIRLINLEHFIKIHTD